MSPEELDRRLAELPPEPPTRDAPRWTQDVSSRAYLSPSGSAYAHFCGGGDPANEELERARRALATERRRRPLESRISPELMVALRRTRTCCALLIGPTGCGKTSGAGWIMGDFGGRLIRATDLATAYKRYPLGEGLPTEVEVACSRQVIVLDDVGAERDVTTIQEVLDHRYSRGYPTVVTSGLTHEELIAHLGMAYYRRIIDQHVRNWPVLIASGFES